MKNATLCMAAVLALGAGFTAGGAQAYAAPGRVFFSAAKIKDATHNALLRQFSKSKPSAEIKASEGRWSAVMVAFFRKPAVGGPVTVWFFDKADKEAMKNREPANIVTVQAGAPQGKFLVHDLELSNDDGFNRNHTYVVRVGQIIGKRQHYYATGEIKLLP